MSLWYGTSGLLLKGKGEKIHNWLCGPFAHRHTIQVWTFSSHSESETQCWMSAAGKEVGMQTKNPSRTDLFLAFSLGLSEVPSPSVGRWEVVSSSEPGVSLLYMHRWRTDSSGAHCKACHTSCDNYSGRSVGVSSTGTRGRALWAKPWSGLFPDLTPCRVPILALGGLIAWRETEPETDIYVWLWSSSWVVFERWSFSSWD